MSLYLCGQWDAAQREVWHAALQAALPGEDWLLQPPTPAQAAEVEVAIVANPPPGALQGLPRLGYIQSLWAGVDRLLADPSLPPGRPLARMVDPAMNAAMAETALWAVLALHRGFFRYAAQQAAASWHVLPQRRADEVGVTVLGQGQMGGEVLRRLQAQGYRARAWRRADGPEGLAALLPVSDVVVNLLPLTAATRGLLNAALFDRLPRGAGVVNLARGPHLVEADLLAALADGRVGHAVLDVFATEPLPADHPFWHHPGITVLPHAAALTDPRSAAEVVAANLRRWRAGDALLHTVDRERGY